MQEEVKDIDAVLKSLTKELGNLKKTVSEQGTEIDRLNRLGTSHKKDMHEAKQTIKKLETENKELKEKLSKYEKPEKDSHNSSPDFDNASPPLTRAHIRALIFRELLFRYYRVYIEKRFDFVMFWCKKHYLLFGYSLLG